MKILIKASRERYERFAPDNDFVKDCDIVYVPLKASDDEIEAAGGLDADVIFADAIAKVPASLIQRMPNLKLIHSEGVAYNGIDIEAAAERNIYVCNNKGANAGAVAEQTILLMLALLRSFQKGREALIDGKQIEIKEKLMLDGITELSEVSVGLIGFGDIAKAVAERLRAFGCHLYYFNRSRKDEQTEAKYGVTYLPLDILLEECDIVSLHIAVTEETSGMVNEGFLRQMKKSSFLINTSRGELVDNEALKDALIRGSIAGAGLDTIAPEPVSEDNPLVALPDEIRQKVEYSPHLGGITTATFRRCHRTMWENAGRICRGERPVNIILR